MAEWSEGELRATVRAYLAMLDAERAGQPYSKAKARQELRQGALKGRSEPSIEYRMRNISAVLASHDQSTIKGYIPAANVGSAKAALLWQLIQAEAGLNEDRPPIIYFNIGWMERYAGVSDTDETKGAHGYLQEHRHGAEAFNFAPTPEGRVRGYRPPGTRTRTDIAALGAPRGFDAIDGVLVVWLAREPASGRTLVVGWYRNATVYRVAREVDIKVNGEPISCTAEAASDHATLVPPALRTFQVQSSRTSPGAGFGQSPTWYGAESVDAAVWLYVQGYDARRVLPIPTLAGPLAPPKNHDPELRRKVEKAAVAHAVAYFEALHGPACEIRSVETEAKGWDLEIYAAAKPLLVEVKGLIGPALACELTPNEYEKMMLSRNRARYVVYVVNNALAESPASPVASIFRHAGGKEWSTEDRRTLTITPKTGAVLTCA